MKATQVHERIEQARQKSIGAKMDYLRMVRESFPIGTYVMYSFGGLHVGGRVRALDQSAPRLMVQQDDGQSFWIRSNQVTDFELEGGG